MRVIATAGHVDHGKSTLVRALTGIEPDRWAEERRRGLTIDLGFAWTTLPGGDTVAFVDVPGHERFIGNMLAGVGPTPAVLFVVAADEGWRRQSQEHLDAISALGVEDGVLAVTRSDLADPRPAVDQARSRLADTALAGIEAVTVSGVTGAGLDDLRAALSRLCDRLPRPDPSARPRLWVDRSFSLHGVGTVITGTLQAGTLRVGDTLEISGREVVVRGLESLGERVERVAGTSRVAVNLRGLSSGEVARGEALIGGRWHATTTADVRLHRIADKVPDRAMAHVGTAADEVRIRALGERHARLTWPRALPLQVGDRVVLRDPGQQAVLARAEVLDVDPPPLSRRGAGRRREDALAGAQPTLDPAREIRRRGYLTLDDLQGLGGDPDRVDPGIRLVAGLLVDEQQWSTWRDGLRTVVETHVRTHPLQARMTMGAAADALGLPDRRLVGPLASDAGLIVSAGHLAVPGVKVDLGAAERGVAALESRWEHDPFAAPERDELMRLGLGPREIAAAARAGRLLDLADLIVLPPGAPAQAMRVLAGLPAPFTMAQARSALGTTRRVAVPLLEHLDARGWTRRVDDQARVVVR